MTFKDVTYTISKPEVYKWDGVSVEVFGGGKEASENDLKMVFQNAKRVGGGPIDDIHIFEECAVVRYKNAEGSRPNA